MSYSAVMTHVQSDPEALPRLNCAVDVARRFDAAMIGVGAEMLPPQAFEGSIYSTGPDWAPALRDIIDGRLAAARKLFSEAARDLKGGCEWLSGVQLPTPALSAASRSVDLIVAGGAPHKMRDPYANCSTAELAITSGRPVLVAPPNAPPLSAKQVVLAWKDSREARRAMSDAMPFFEQADRVVVVAIVAKADAEDGRRQIDDVANALKRRGIKAEAKLVEHAHADGFELLRQATLEHADLLVCGAYGHSRLGEWAFGGVTADLLSQESIYLLLSH
jgi:nucleotide-binding universal stress UspA family protein